MPRLLNDLRVAHGEGIIAKLYRELARIDLMVLDDWGLAPIEPVRGRDLLEILDDQRVAAGVVEAVRRVVAGQAEDAVAGPEAVFWVVLARHQRGDEGVDVGPEIAGALLQPGAGCWRRILAEALKKYLHGREPGRQPWLPPPRAAPAC